MQNYQQYPQYTYQGQSLPPVAAAPAQTPPQPDATAPSSHPLAPLATISFWSTVVQRTLQVESPAAVASSDPFASAATVTDQPQPLPQPLSQPHVHSQQHHQYYYPPVATSATPQPQPLPLPPPQTDLISLILGIPPVISTTLVPPPPSRVSIPYQQQQPVPPQPIHQQSSSFLYPQQQQQPVPIIQQHQSYWPVAPQPAPTATSLTHDLGISLLHLAFAAARFGFKATTALTHFIVSNPLTRPMAHLWIHALKQLAAFAVNAVKVIVHAVITGGQPQQPQQSIMGTGGGGDGNAAMASMMMQLATSGMMGPSSARW